MDSGLLNGGEDTSALNDVFGASAGPVDVGRIPFTEDDNLGAIDVQEGAVVLDLAYNVHFIIQDTALFHV